MFGQGEGGWKGLMAHSILPKPFQVKVNLFWLIDFCNWIQWFVPPTVRPDRQNDYVKSKTISIMIYLFIKYMMRECISIHLSIYIRRGLIQSNSSGPKWTSGLESNKPVREAFLKHNFWWWSMYIVDYVIELDHASETTTVTNSGPVTLDLCDHSLTLQLVSEMNDRCVAVTVVSAG